MENKITYTKHSIQTLRESFKRHNTQTWNIRRRRKLKWSKYIFEIITAKNILLLRADSKLQTRGALKHEAE